MTVSAVAKLIPAPPALVDNKKMLCVDFGRLKASIRVCLSNWEVVPSYKMRFELCDKWV